MIGDLLSSPEPLIVDCAAASSLGSLVYKGTKIKRQLLFTDGHCTQNVFTLIWNSFIRFELCNHITTLLTHSDLYIGASCSNWEANITNIITIHKIYKSIIYHTHTRLHFHKNTLAIYCSTLRKHLVLFKPF